MADFDFELMVRECRLKAHQLLADLDSAEVTEDEEELAIALEDAGSYFLGASEEVPDGD